MAEVIKKVVKAIPMLLDFPEKSFHLDYDDEADVVYVSFDRPQRATETETTDEGILLRYRDGKMVGITILNASRFKK